jgi:GNAT superfamily N-acetyltransferase
MKERIKIDPLSEKTLTSACKLTLDVFHPNINDKDYPPKWLKASLKPEINKELYLEFDIMSLKYWVALDTNNRVFGIIGLYTLSYDEKEAYWLGWYCVDPKSRGKGVGKLLLNFVISKAKKDGKKWLRLYTSNEPNERRANEIYDKLGFKLIKNKKINEIINSKRFKEFTKGLVYKELNLN